VNYSFNIFEIVISNVFIITVEKPNKSIIAEENHLTDPKLLNGMQFVLIILQEKNSLIKLLLSINMIFPLFFNRLCH